jgi:hypothetical protein
MDVKPIKLLDGMILRHGQIIKPNIARDGAPKKLTTPALAHGAKNRIAEHTLKPNFSNPLDDEKLEKNFRNGKHSPVHPGMWTQTPEHRAKDEPGCGSAMLQSAARFGRAQ